jgi:hypothetical protein
MGMASAKLSLLHQAEVVQLIPRFYINSDGLVSVMADGSFYSPAINTPLLKINGTNISVLYQSKADMANYITSGTLTNYVNTTGNQSIGGKKSFTGGITYQITNCIRNYGFR